MTLEKLQRYNGQKAYVAYKGKVYDVTGSRFMKNT